MSPEFDPEYNFNKFVLPEITKWQSEDTEVYEYTGVKYLGIPILRDKIAVKIDGDPILEYDAFSNKILNCNGIDASSVYITDKISCHYHCLGEGQYSCEEAPSRGPQDPENISFIIIPCHVSTRISMRKNDHNHMKFDISRNWNVKVYQYKDDGEDTSFSGFLMRGRDSSTPPDHEAYFRFLFPDNMDNLKRDAFGHEGPHDVYLWYLKYDIIGFEREWLIQNNFGIAPEILHPKPREKCFIVTPEYVEGKSVKLE